MPYMFTVNRGLQLLLLYYTGLLPFVPLGESFLQFYLPQIFNRSVYTKNLGLRLYYVVCMVITQMHISLNSFLQRIYTRHVDFEKQSGHLFNWKVTFLSGVKINLKISYFEMVFCVSVADWQWEKACSGTSETEEFRFVVMLYHAYML